MDVAKLESMGCLFGNRQGQRKRDMQQWKVRSRNGKRDTKVCKSGDRGCLAIDRCNLNQNNNPDLWL